MTKITAQELHDALNHALDDLGKEAQDVLGITPKPWEELREEQQSVINRLAFAMNCIESEFTDD